MTSSYLLYQTTSQPIKQDPPTIVTRTDINMPGFSQKPFDPFTHNDTTSTAGFQPPPPTRPPPPVPLQQAGMNISSFPHRPLEMSSTANMDSSAIPPPSSGNHSDPITQGRNNSVTQSSAGTNGSNDGGARSPGIFASLMGRAPRMTKSRSCSISFTLTAFVLRKV